MLLHDFEINIFNWSKFIKEPDIKMCVWNQFNEHIVDYF